MTGRPNIQTPSFEPWVGRVRATRAVGAALAFTVTGALSYTGGMPLEDAALRGMVVAIVAYFVVWGAALWLCTELYFAQVRGLRHRLQELEQQRADQLQDFYMQRLSDQGGKQPDALDATTPMQPPMAQRPAA